MLLPDLVHKRDQLLVGSLRPGFREILRHLLDRCHQILRKVIGHQDTEEEQEHKHADNCQHHVLGQSKNIVAFPCDPQDPAIVQTDRVIEHVFIQCGRAAGIASFPVFQRHMDLRTVLMVLHRGKVCIAVKDHISAGVDHRDAQRIGIQIIGIRVQIRDTVKDMHIFHDKCIRLQIPDHLFLIDPVKNE